MKKKFKTIISILMIFAMTLCTTTYSSNIDIANNQTLSQNNFTKRLKTFFESEFVKIMFDGKSLTEILTNAILNISLEEKEEIENKYQISLDKSNFETDELKFSIFEKLIKAMIKEEIEAGKLTNKPFDALTMILRFLGKPNIPNINIKKGMTDHEIEVLCDQILDILLMVTDEQTLKILGIDLNNPDTIAELKRNIESSLN